MGSGAEHQSSLVQKGGKKGTHSTEPTTGRELSVGQNDIYKILREHDDLVLVGNTRYLKYSLSILDPITALGILNHGRDSLEGLGRKHRPPSFPVAKLQKHAYRYYAEACHNGGSRVC